MIRLHEIAGNFLALEALLFESDGELTPTIEEWMKENEGDLATKADNYAALITEWETESARWKAEAERYAARAKTLENSAKRLKERLNQQLIELGKAKVEGPRFTVAVQNNGTPRLAVEALPALFPASYIREVPAVAATIAVDTDALAIAFKEALPPKPKKGEEVVPGPKELLFIARIDDAGKATHHVIWAKDIQPTDMRMAAFTIGTHVRLR